MWCIKKQVGSLYWCPKTSASTCQHIILLLPSSLSPSGKLSFIPFQGVGFLVHQLNKTFSLSTVVSVDLWFSSWEIAWTQVACKKRRSIKFLKRLRPMSEHIVYNIVSTSLSTFKVIYGYKLIQDFVFSHTDSFKSPWPVLKAISLHMQLWVQSFVFPLSTLKMSLYCYLAWNLSSITVTVFKVSLYFWL